jgi:RNA polymerase sigma factor (sigma-70 family)
MKAFATDFETVTPTQTQCQQHSSWRPVLLDVNPSQYFARELLKHSGCAYRLARQLTGNMHDADDVVQEAFLRAFRSRSRFRGGDARPWLLRIVRNVFYTWIQRNPICEPIDRAGDLRDSTFPDPEQTLVRRTVVQNALKTLPTHCREVLILREVEEMSYRDISALLRVPEGTVMSRLSRARAHIRRSPRPVMKPEH